MNKRLVAAAVGIFAVALVGLTGSFAQNSSGPEAEIKQQIDTFYKHYNAGEFKEAFDLIAVGSSGYLVKGGLMKFDTKEAKDEVVGFLDQMKKDGWKMSSKMEDLDIHASESGAVVTYTSNETNTNPQGEETKLQVRCTEVWVNHEGEWKLFHWHFSEMPEGEE